MALINVEQNRRERLSAQDRAREDRDKKLADTDYIFSTIDRPISNRQEWLDYRQALRDWPSSEDFPENPPVEPLRPF